MLSIGRMTAGAGYEYLTREVATSRHDYYAGRGEATGQWWGQGLARLGLSDEVTTDQMAALYGQALDPETGEPLGRRFPVYRPYQERLDGAIEAWTSQHGRAPQGDQLVALRGRLSEAPQRQAIAALDLTFSPVKSVSALWAIAGEELRGEIEAAHDAAVATALGHLQDVASVTRTGTNGVRTVDTEGWIVARFTHRMSRARDPQLHTHCAVLNRVYCPQDGRWRTLDSRAIYRLAVGGGGIYTRVLEDELTRRIGVAWRDVEVGGPTPRREITGVPEDLARGWSKRRAQVEATLDDLGQTPRSAKVRALAAQAAVLQTRPAKGQPEASPHDRWRAEASSLGHDSEAVAQAVAPGPLDPSPTADPAAEPARPGPSVAVWWEAEQVLDRAVERLEANAATWRRGNLVRAVAEALPPGPRTATEASTLVDQLVARVERSGRLVAVAAPEPVEVPVELQRADGTSVYRPAAGMRYTTPGILAAEARIVDAARQVDPTLVIASDTVEAVLAAGPRAGGTYGQDQADAVRDLCASGQRLEVLIGPAGAGKTTTMRAVVEAWQATGRRVVGLTVAQSAARVLGEETGARAHNIARWLTTQAARPDDPDWQLQAGDLLLVDEVGMVPTGQLDELRRQAVDAGAKLVGVGDPLQLGPVGAGGAARLVADDVGATYLAELHRFTHQWEASASLALRHGDPGAASAYDAQGRLGGGDRETAPALAQRAWLADHLAGRDSLLLAVSRTQVADMAGWCRARLVDQRLVDDHPNRTVVLHDDNRAGAGDRVVTRRNDRTLGVANRDVWEIEQVGVDGSLAVRHLERGQSTILPADYVSRRVELAYATTVAAAQSRTVDTTHVVAAMGMDRESLYVGMTRGRDANHAYLVIEDFLHEEFGGGRTDPAAAFEVIVDQDPGAVAATEALRSELAQADSLATWGPIAQDLDIAVTRRQVLAYLQHRYGPGTADNVDTSPAAGALIALVRRSVTVDAEPERVLAHVCRADLDGARSEAQVLAARVRRTLDQLGSGRLHSDQLASPVQGWQAPDGPVERYYREIGELMTARAQTLGDLAAAQPPGWALDQWGEVPHDPVARAMWARASGAVAAYRERWQHDATPAQLAESEPQRRDVDRWRDWQRIRVWLELDSHGIGNLASSGPDRDLIDSEHEALVADLRAVNDALDRREHLAEHDAGPVFEPPPLEPPGPDLDL